MSEKYRIERGIFATNWKEHVFYLVISLLILFPLSISAFADTSQSDLFPQILGPRFEGTQGEIQTMIDLLSEQLTSDPYRAKLYYYLARGYARQGWSDRAAQYMSQWIKFSNSDVVMRGSHAFIVDEKNDKVLVIDMATKQVVREIDVGWFPRRIIPTPGDGRLYVTNALANNVSAIDAEKMAVTKTIETGRMPWNGKSSPQGDRVYVTNLKSDDVSVIDTKSDTVMETVKVGQGPWGIAISPDGHRLYVSNQDSRSIQVVDTGSYSIVDVINVGTYPQDIALAPDDEKKLYAVDRDVVSDKVEIYVVDLEDARVVEALNVPAIDDPLLSRVEKMSLEGKLALIGTRSEPDEEPQEHIAKPEVSDPSMPALASRSPDSSTRPVAAKDTMPEPAKPPVGGPVPLVKSEQAAEANVKVSAASSDKPMPLQQPDLASPSARMSEIPHDRLTEPEPLTEASVKAAPASSRKALPPRKPEPTREPTELPIDDPAALAEPEPATELYAKVPSPSSLKVLPSPEPELASESESAIPQETLEREKRVQRIIVVVKRDTLWQLSISNYGAANYSILRAIQAVNPKIKDLDKIYVGQKIKFPDLDSVGKTVVVKPKDNLFRLALSNYGTVSKKIYAAILEANPQIRRIDKIYVGQRIILPALSSVSSKTHA